MNIPLLAARNILRNKFRTTLTIIGVAVTVLTFILLRTVLDAWNVGVDYAAKDRIATRHKVTFVVPLPLRYFDEIAQTPGVTASTFANWFGAKYPRREQEFFGNMAVESKSFFRVYDEMKVPPDQLERWQQTQDGAIVGEVLAKKMGWKIGDRVTLRGTIYPGDWNYTISGFYKATRKSVDASQFLFHWKYLNESVAARSKDMIGWVVSRVDNPSQAAQISATIDKRFEDRDIQTLSMSERAMNNSFMAMFSAVLTAINIVSIVILIIMMLILGNTIAMGVRERTSEYGILRAIGFLPRHMGAFVTAEAITIGTLGGLLGIAISYPFIEKGLGRWIEENMGAWFPYFRISMTTAIAAVVLSIIVAALAALIPAYQASRLNVVNALRRLG